MCTNTQLQTAITKIRSISQKIYGNKLDKIILYGSYARGDYTEESDIDIMILLNCDADETRRLRKKTADMASGISLEQEVFLSITIKDKKNFEDNIEILPFYQNVVREGIILYE